VCREQFTDNSRGTLHLLLVEPASCRDSDILIVQRANNILLRDGLNPFVLDPANNRLLPNNEHDDFSVWPVGTIFHFQAHIVEKRRVPECLGITLDSFDAEGSPGCDETSAATVAVSTRRLPMRSIRSIKYFVWEFS
jgi:hypothetical protein